ncbi:superoxide dismutase family protein [Streptomyces sp. HNM0574]|uniref:superoxide dismutase family protein n=1 Tax=Streptomyces sp. HNM0574 TaxID=2714954 RepID=UPI00146E7105|nr:superoxide dismutase family protein [Streptomyces sp. HNM0574]NLU69289.1 superoxide dismutase family protein [Streptomyces sp. HNM0574]
MAAGKATAVAAAVAAMAAAATVTVGPGVAGAQSPHAAGPGGGGTGAPVTGSAHAGEGGDVRSGTKGDTFWLTAHGKFARPGAGATPPAVTYDTRAVPEGARIAVAQRSEAGRTKVAVKVSGLEPNRTFGAHVHTKPCADVPDSSGPHYQNRKDPVQPSKDPAYANPRNEVWLDMSTDAKGRASAKSGNDWNFRKGGARSVVIHEHATHTGHGEAGVAGDRLACFSVPFGR